jgi:general secretion pathway protein B
MKRKAERRMSYIFEALKKLEQKRQREGVSRLLMVTGEAARERKRWPAWPLTVLSALLLLNAGAVIWWFRPWTPHRTSTQEQPPAVYEKRTSEVPAITPQGAKEQDRPNDAKEVARPKAASGSAAPVATKESPDISRAEQVPARRPANPEPRVRSESPAVAGGRVLALKELPAAVKSSLPELKISAHYYTVEPQSRFTRINEQTAREGQTLDSGVKLEEITPDGVVLSHRGYRFQVGISEGR